MQNAGKMACQLKAHIVPAKHLSLFPSMPFRLLIITYNSSSRDSDSLFWFAQTPVLKCIHPILDTTKIKQIWKKMNIKYVQKLTNNALSWMFACKQVQKYWWVYTTKIEATLNGNQQSHFQEACVVTLSLHLCELTTQQKVEPCVHLIFCI